MAGRDLRVRENFIRFYLADILPASVSHALWLDADTAVRCDLDGLYADVERAAAAAAKGPKRDRGSEALLAVVPRQSNTKSGRAAAI